MLVHNHKRFYVRNYLLVLNKTEEATYVGVFSELKYRSENYGKVHLWLNFNRFNTETNQIDYFYMFLKNEIQLYDSFYLGFKLSHRYSRTSGDKVKNQFSLDVSWQI